MNFPYSALLTLLQFARGKRELDQEVISAGLDVLRYAWAQIQENVFPKGDVPADATPAQLIEAVLADHLHVDNWRVELVDADLKPVISPGNRADIEGALQDRAEPIGFAPGVWITLGLWILEIVAKRWLESR